MSNTDLSDSQHAEQVEEKLAAFQALGCHCGMGLSLMPCAFASLRFNGVGCNAETQRRKDAKRNWPRRGCLDRSAARDRREPEREILD